MDFNEILVDIILNEKHDGDKGIDWLYGEYVKRGYNKSKEMFCEEFVKNMDGQGTNDLTESEATQVAGGNGKFIKRGASVGLAAALLAGPLMPTHRAKVSANISEGNQEGSIQGLYQKAKRIINNIFNDKNSKTISELTVGGTVAFMLGAGFIYLIIRIVKESKTPAEVLQNTTNGIHGILNNTQKSNKKDDILKLLKECLDALLKFVPEDQENNLRKKFEASFGKPEAPTVFNTWKQIQEAFTKVFGDIKDKLENNPLKKLFEYREKDLTAVFESKEEPKKEEPKYDVNKIKNSYTTEALKDNGTVSKETGIKQDVLEEVDNFVKQQGEGINYKELTKDSVLVVCKNMAINSASEDNLKDKIEEISTVHGTKNLYLVLKDCKVSYTRLPKGSNIKVLDLRGTTSFSSALDDAAAVEKVLLRNNPKNKARQLQLSYCEKLGPIYQLSNEDTRMGQQRLLLTTCRLAENFKFVNLNSCCTKLLEKWCLYLCTCPVERLKDIKDNSFNPNSQPDEENLKGVSTKK